MAKAMTTERTIGAPAAAPTRSPVAAAWIAVAAVIGVIAYNARMGAVSPRIANPEVTGVPRPVEFLFGWPHWLVARSTTEASPRETVPKNWCPAFRISSGAKVPLLAPRCCWAAAGAADSSMTVTRAAARRRRTVMNEAPGFDAGLNPMLTTPR